MTNKPEGVGAAESLASKIAARAMEQIRAFATAILHGDDEHRDWLLEAAERFIAGQPLPEPRGKGTAKPSPSAGVNAELLEALACARDALEPIAHMSTVEEGESADSLVLIIEANRECARNGLAALRGAGIRLSNGGVSTGRASAEPTPAVTDGRSEIEWHRLVDGDPKETGRYIVAHRGCSKQINFYDGDGSSKRGWTADVSAYTHWAKEPCAPDDGTPQLFTSEGLRQRAEAVEAAGWDTLSLPQTREATQGEPAAIYRGNGILDCGDAGHHNIELLKLIPANTPLYTSPSPAAPAEETGVARELIERLSDISNADDLGPDTTAVREALRDAVRSLSARATLTPSLDPATVEACAKVADEHKGRAAEKRRAKGLKLAGIRRDVADEIIAEERGEDIAAEIIARTIRALIPQQGR